MRQNPVGEPAAASGGWETDGMGATKRSLARLWPDESGISSVEYALLLAMIAGGIVMGADMLSDAIVNEMNDTAAMFDEDTCGNDGSGDGTGGAGGAGQGGDNTC